MDVKNVINFGKLLWEQKSSLAFWKKVAYFSLNFAYIQILVELHIVRRT